MIHFRRYPEDRYDPAKYYGFAFEKHPKRKALQIFWGRRVYAFWTGRSY